MTSLLTPADVHSAITDTIPSVLKAVAKVSEHGMAMTEAMTEMIVIDKILIALGYEPWDIQKQGVVEGVGNFPDYSILPHAPQQWFIEVKRWKLTLTDKEASQAVNYASNLGKRWAVLTNGDEWRVLDAFSNAHLKQKCILSLPSISDSSAVSFFGLLSKASMIENQLAASYRSRVIQEAVLDELSNVASSIMKKLAKDIEVKTGLPAVKKEEVFDALSSLIGNESTVQIPDLNPIVPPPPPVNSTANEPSLLALAHKTISPTFGNPSAVIFPDNTETATKDWRDVTVAVLVWVLNHHGIPDLPFRNGSTGHSDRYFLNTEPIHPDRTPWVAQRLIVVGDKTVYIYAHNSAISFCRRMLDVVSAVGGDPSAIRIRLD